MFTPPSDMISEKAAVQIVAKLDVANVGGGINTTPAVCAREPAASVCAFCAAIWKAFNILKSHKDESLKIFSKYVRNPDLAIMAYLYEEISNRAEKETAAAG